MLSEDSHITSGEVIFLWAICRLTVKAMFSYQHTPDTYFPRHCLGAYKTAFLALFDFHPVFLPCPVYSPLNNDLLTSSPPKSTET